MNTIILLGLTMINVATQEAPKHLTDRALVLSGGGSHGAYQVGVLTALKIKEENERAFYKHFYGTSVGAVNGLFLAMNTRWNSIDRLEILWEHLQDDNVKKHWRPFSFLHAWKKRGLYDTTPLRKLLQSHFDYEKLLDTGNTLTVGALNLNTLEHELFDEKCPVDLVQAVMASSAFPVVMPPEKIGLEYYNDGGVRQVALAALAIKRAIADGYTDIDVILADPRYNMKVRDTPKNLLDVGLRSLQCSNNEVFRNNLKEALELAFQYKQINLRIFEPTKELEFDPMNFDNQPIREMMSLGYTETMGDRNVSDKYRAKWQDVYR